MIGSWATCVKGDDRHHVSRWWSWDGVECQLPHASMVVLQATPCAVLVDAIDAKQARGSLTRLTNVKDMGPLHYVAQLWPGIFCPFDLIVTIVAALV